MVNGATDYVFKNNSSGLYRPSTEHYASLNLKADVKWQILNSMKKEHR
jgi:hypothetical protein